MSAPTCPHCNRELSAEMLRDGWCEECGKQIPAYLTPHADTFARLPSFSVEAAGEEYWSRRSSRLTSGLASRMSRLGAALLDSLAAVVFCGPGYFLILMAHKGMDDQLAILGSLLLLIGVASLLVMQIAWLTTRGQSIGKRLVGVRIARANDGGNPGFVGAVLLRAVVPGMIGAIPCFGAIFSVVDILLIFAEDRRCVHDHIAGTIVVDA